MENSPEMSKIKNWSKLTSCEIFFHTNFQVTCLNILPKFSTFNC